MSFAVTFDINRVKVKWTDHPFEADAVEVLGAVVPDDIGGGAGGGGGPVLHFIHLPSPPIPAVLILPLPVHTPHHSRPGEYTPDPHLQQEITNKSDIQQPQTEKQPFLIFEPLER